MEPHQGFTKSPGQFRRSEIGHPKGMPERRITWMLFVNDFERAQRGPKGEGQEARSKSLCPDQF